MNSYKSINININKINKINKKNSKSKIKSNSISNSTNLKELSIFLKSKDTINKNKILTNKKSLIEKIKIKEKEKEKNLLEENFILLNKKIKRNQRIISPEKFERFLNIYNKKIIKPSINPNEKSKKIFY